MATEIHFEYVNENSIHEDLRCSLCTDPFDEPVSGNQCGHTFCRKCITEALRISNKCPTCRQILKLTDFHSVKTRPFLNQLNQLLVKCKSCSITDIERGNFNDHMKQCENINVQCSAVDIGCDWIGKRDQLKEHIRTCVLMKIQPKINQLNDLLKKQKEKTCFLFTILENISNNNKNACREGYKNDIPDCDICDQSIRHGSHLHFCPNTDICRACIAKHFS